MVAKGNINYIPLILECALQIFVLHWLKISKEINQKWSHMHMPTHV